MRSCSTRCDLLFSLVLVVAELFAASSVGLCGDWPQILGPERSGNAVGETISDKWPAAGPRILWQREVGSGVAGVSVVGDRGVLFHRRGDADLVEAFDVRTGQSKWQQQSPTDFSPQVGGDNGPLCVPTIAGRRVITFAPQGVLSCWDLDSGKRLWQRKTHEEYGAREGYFGAGSSPLVVTDRVIVNVGGLAQGAGLVAFALGDGRELWQAVKDGPSYSAPTLAIVRGEPLVLAVTQLNFVGVEPQTGEVRFQVPFGRRGATVNAAAPVLLKEDHVFLTASYGIGAVLLQETQGSLAELYRRGDVLSSQYTTPILHEGCLIGIDGRDDVPPAHLKCVDPISGQVLWSVDNFGYATLIKADGKLLIVTTSGDLVLSRPRRDRYEELGRFSLTSKTLRALPALADGRLFVRDSETLYCLDVAKAE